MPDKDKNDPVKKVFGKTAKEILSTDRSHTDAHSPNAFCGNAGPEEMKHFQRLLDELTDDEIVLLTDAVGISFGMPARIVERDQLEGALDEADRETFYREYNRLMNERRFANQDGMDKASRQYAEVCQAYIRLVAQNQLDIEEAARRINNEEPDKPLHPMLRAVSGLAFDIAENVWPSEQKKNWQELTQTVKDFLSGKWYATAWTMNGTYLHRSRKHGFGFTVGFHDTKPCIETSDATARKVLEAATKTLNSQQTAERFLQNFAMILPQTIGENELDSVRIIESLR